MTPTLWIALYVFFALILCACAYGYALGEAQSYDDEREAYRERQRAFFAARRAEAQADIEERRAASFRNLDRLAAQQAHSARVDAAAYTWSA